MALPITIDTYCYDAKEKFDVFFRGKKPEDKTRENAFVIPKENSDAELKTYLEQNGIQPKLTIGNLNGYRFSFFCIEKFSKAQYESIISHKATYGVLTTTGLPWDFFGDQGMP